MNHLTHLQAFCSDDGKRGREWTDGNVLYRRSLLNELEHKLVDGGVWGTSRHQVVTKPGECHWADDAHAAGGTASAGSGRTGGEVMLTDEQLERALFCARLYLGECFSSGGAEYARGVVEALLAELYRRNRGPFTFAEAIASGRPFRRKAWAPLSWARISEHVYNGGALLVFVVGGSAIPVGPNDIAACDYELQEGGE